MRSTWLSATLSPCDSRCCFLTGQSPAMAPIDSNHDDSTITRVLHLSAVSASECHGQAMRGEEGILDRV